MREALRQVPIYRISREYGIYVADRACKLRKKMFPPDWQCAKLARFIARADRMPSKLGVFGKGGRPHFEQPAASYKASIPRGQNEYATNASFCRFAFNNCVHFPLIFLEFKGSIGEAHAGDAIESR